MGSSHGNDTRNFAGCRNNRSAGQRHAAGNLPRVQSHAAEQIGQVFVRDIQTGRCSLALLALFIFWREIL